MSTRSDKIEDLPMLTKAARTDEHNEQILNNMKPSTTEAAEHSTAPNTVSTTSSDEKGSGGMLKRIAMLFITASILDLPFVTEQFTSLLGIQNNTRIVIKAAIISIVAYILFGL